MTSVGLTSGLHKKRVGMCSLGLSVCAELPLDLAYQELIYKALFNFPSVMHSRFVEKRVSLRGIADRLSTGMFHTKADIA